MIKPEEKHRVSKTDTYLNVAEAFAYRSTCIKRKYGAVIVKNDVVVSTGYNGSPRGYDNCCDIGTCPRMERNMHQGEGYDICRAIHAEQNALLNCSREQTLGADLYLTGVVPEYQSKGVNALLFNDLIPIYRRIGAVYAESNPELETNSAVQAQWDYFKREHHKTRRAYLKAIDN